MNESRRDVLGAATMQQRMAAFTNRLPQNRATLAHFHGLTSNPFPDVTGPILEIADVELFPIVRLLADPQVLRRLTFGQLRALQAYDYQLAEQARNDWLVLIFTAVMSHFSHNNPPVLPRCLDDLRGLHDLQPHSAYQALTGVAAGDAIADLGDFTTRLTDDGDVELSATLPDLPTPIEFSNPDDTPFSAQQWDALTDQPLSIWPRAIAHVRQNARRETKRRHTYVWPLAEHKTALQEPQPARHETEVHELTPAYRAQLRTQAAIFVPDSLADLARAAADPDHPLAPDLLFLTDLSAADEAFPLAGYARRARTELPRGITYGQHDALLNLHGQLRETTFARWLLALDAHVLDALRQRGPHELPASRHGLVHQTRRGTDAIRLLEEGPDFALTISHPDVVQAITEHLWHDPDNHGPWYFRPARHRRATATFVLRILWTAADVDPTPG